MKFLCVACDRVVVTDGAVPSGCPSCGAVPSLLVAVPDPIMRSPSRVPVGTAVAVGVGAVVVVGYFLWARAQAEPSPPDAAATTAESGLEASADFPGDDGGEPDGASGPETEPGGPRLELPSLGAGAGGGMNRPRIDYQTP